MLKNAFFACFFFSKIRKNPLENFFDQSAKNGYLKQYKSGRRIPERKKMDENNQTLLTWTFYLIQKILEQMIQTTEDEAQNWKGRGIL